MSKTEEEFHRDLKGSFDAQFALAKHLCKKGKDLYIPGLQIAPSYKERYKYMDDGDLFVVNKDGSRYCIQVKGSPQSFKSVKSWPYPDIIVDESYKIKRQEKNPPRFYATVNGELTGCITIRWDTKEHWFEREMWDRRQRDKRKFTLCNLEHCRYTRFK